MDVGWTVVGQTVAWIIVAWVALSLPLGICVGAMLRQSAFGVHLAPGASPVWRWLRLESHGRAIAARVGAAGQDAALGVEADPVTATHRPRPIG